MHSKLLKGNGERKCGVVAKSTVGMKVTVAPMSAGEERVERFSQRDDKILKVASIQGMHRSDDFSGWPQVKTNCHYDSITCFIILCQIW